MFFACSPCYADLRVLDICLHMYLSYEAQVWCVQIYEHMHICMYIYMNTIYRAVYTTVHNVHVPIGK